MRHKVPMGALRLAAREPATQRNCFLRLPARFALQQRRAYISLMALDLNNLAEIIANRDFNRLVGEVEGQFFDAKGQPYRFDIGMDAKREFAKDVAAFANARGGYILIGIATTPAALRAGEEVSEVRPVDRTAFDADRHRKLLEEWLYPHPKGIDIDWVQFGKDNGKGIGLIFVPPQNEVSKPFLIRRTIGDRKSTEVLIGYAERRVDRTDVKNIVEIHQALRTGLNLERELLGKIANIEFLMERYFSVKVEVETNEKREQVFKERIARLIEEDND